jgi:hypothetical protein
MSIAVRRMNTFISAEEPLLVRSDFPSVWEKTDMRASVLQNNARHHDDNAGKDALSSNEVVRYDGRERRGTDCSESICLVGYPEQGAIGIAKLVLLLITSLEAREDRAIEVIGSAYNERSRCEDKIDLDQGCVRPSRFWSCYTRTAATRRARTVLGTVGSILLEVISGCGSKEGHRR